jgi:hypothetical protein
MGCAASIHVTEDVLPTVTTQERAALAPLIVGESLADPDQPESSDYSLDVDLVLAINDLLSTEDGFEAFRQYLIANFQDDHVALYLELTRAKEGASLAKVTLVYSDNRPLCCTTPSASRVHQLLLPAW